MNPQPQFDHKTARPSSVSGAAGVVGLVLSAFTSLGAGIPILLIVIAAVCGLMFRGMTKSS